MSSISVKKSVRLLFFLIGCSSLTVSAQNGEATFKQTCAACHSIGKGKLVGPDLKDVASRRKEDWILKFVKSSQGFINSGDADAKALFDEFNGMVMPDQNLSDAEIKDIIAYITAQSGSASTATTTETAPAVEEPKNDTSAFGKLSADEKIKMGKAYFEGSMAFVNGGPSCISCHNVNYPELLRGGLLAKDLTNCFSRLGGEAGISGILSAPPFPAMTVAFKDNPLTEQEIGSLIAFFQAADKPNAVPSTPYDPLLVGGLIGFVTVFILILLIWNKRKRNTVKKDIYERQIKSI